ncbi:MAG: hypothetical protein JO340_06060 [Acidobacteriaceae bacterium]|nr:hypothetical protein [Acidobacteriaceae bacterium]
MRAFWVALVIVAGVSPPARATSIVILRSPGRIYVGADSRRMYRDPAATFQGTVCKIVPAGQFYFVASGLTYANDEQVADLGAEAGRDAHSIRAATQRLVQRMQQFLPPALAAENQIEHQAAENRPSLVLETAFIGIQDGSALVALQLYRRDGQNPRFKVESHTYSSSTPGRYDFIFLGKRRAIDARLAGRFPRIQIQNDSDAVAFISQMIGLEASESPETTAPPVDILEIDSSGSRWLKRKPACQDQAPHPIPPARR